MQDTIKLLLPVVVAHAVILVVIVLVLKRVLLGDTMEAVARLRQVEAEVRKKEEGIRKEIEAHEKEFVQKKAEAEEQLDQHRAAIEKEVGKMRDQVLADAQKDAEQVMLAAKKNEEKFKDQLRRDMELKAVNYGSEIFKMVFSEKMTRELDKHFVGELLDALDEVDAAGISIDAGSAEFTACHPLDSEQKARLEKLIIDKFGVTIQVKEKTREDLMAGLVLKMGSLEIDGSLLSRYQEAAAEVKKTAGI